MSRYTEVDMALSTIGFVIDTGELNHNEFNEICMSVSGLDGTCAVITSWNMSPFLFATLAM